MSDKDIFERLVEAAKNHEEWLPLVKGEIHGCYPVPVCIQGVNSLDFEPTSATLGPGETLRYWLCIGDGRAWYEFELIPAAGVRPVSSSS